METSRRFMLQHEIKNHNKSKRFNFGLCAMQMSARNCLLIFESFFSVYCFLWGFFLARAQLVGPTTVQKCENEWQPTFINKRKPFNLAVHRDRDTLLINTLTEADS